MHFVPHIARITMSRESNAPANTTLSNDVSVTAPARAFREDSPPRHC